MIQPSAPKKAKSRKIMTNRSSQQPKVHFPVRLYDMMTYVETECLESAIGWVLGGRGFVIHDQDKLMSILPRFFSFTKFSSFVRQLNMWDFERIGQGINKGTYIHPYFIKGNRELCCGMNRQLKTKKPRASPCSTSRSSSVHSKLEQRQKSKSTEIIKDSLKSKTSQSKRHAQSENDCLVASLLRDHLYPSPPAAPRAVNAALPAIIVDPILSNKCKKILETKEDKNQLITARVEDTKAILSSQQTDDASSNIICSRLPRSHDGLESALVYSSQDKDGTVLLDFGLEISFTHASDMLSSNSTVPSTIEKILKDRFDEEEMKAGPAPEKTSCSSNDEKMPVNPSSDDSKDGQRVQFLRNASGDVFFCGGQTGDFSPLEGQDDLGCFAGRSFFCVLEEDLTFC